MKNSSKTCKKILHNIITNKPRKRYVYTFMHGLKMHHKNKKYNLLEEENVPFGSKLNEI